MSTIETSAEAALLTAAEEAALNVLMAGPLVGVHVRIAVKFRAMQHDIGTLTVIDHSWQWPIPALFASANPHPVDLNTHGIQLDVTLSEPAADAPQPVESSSTSSTAGTGQAPSGGGDLLGGGGSDLS